jgi:hypothetical protein
MGARRPAPTTVERGSVCCSYRQPTAASAPKRGITGVESTGLFPWRQIDDAPSRELPPSRRDTARELLSAFRPHQVSQAASSAPMNGRSAAPPQECPMHHSLEALTRSRPQGDAADMEVQG